MVGSKPSHVERNSRGPPRLPRAWSSLAVTVVKRRLKRDDSGDGAGCGSRTDLMRVIKSCVAPPARRRRRRRRRLQLGRSGSPLGEATRACCSFVHYNAQWRKQVAEQDIHQAAAVSPPLSFDDGAQPASHLTSEQAYQRPLSLGGGGVSTWVRAAFPPRFIAGYALLATSQPLLQCRAVSSSMPCSIFRSSK